MGLLGAADSAYALRFLRLLTMPWERTAAFKTGVIDNEGARLKRPETREEKNAYTIFHRLVFNIRRMLAKFPLGKTTISRYLSAFWLIKEKTGMSDDDILKVISEVCDADLTMDDIRESPLMFNAWLNEDGVVECGMHGVIKIGDYVLAEDVSLPTTGDMLAYKGTMISNPGSKPVGSILGTPVFPVYHHDTCSTIFVTEASLKKENMVAGSIEGRPMPFRKRKRGDIPEEDLDEDDDELEEVKIFKSFPDGGTENNTKAVWGDLFTKGKIAIRWSQMRGGYATWVSGRMEGELHDTKAEAMEWLKAVGVEKRRLPKL